MTCGYVCPVCEGKGTDDEGNPCDYCTAPVQQEQAITDEAWIKNVHEGACCSDL